MSCMEGTDLSGHQAYKIPPLAHALSRTEFLVLEGSTFTVSLASFLWLFVARAGKGTGRANA